MSVSREDKYRVSSPLEFELWRQRPFVAHIANLTNDAYRYLNHSIFSFDTDSLLVELRRGGQNLATLANIPHPREVTGYLQSLKRWQNGRHAAGVVLPDFRVIAEYAATMDETAENTRSLAHRAGYSALRQVAGTLDSKAMMIENEGFRFAVINASGEPVKDMRGHELLFRTPDARNRTAESIVSSYADTLKFLYGR